jgi:ABC-type transport system substrate-binding protein
MASAMLAVFTVMAVGCNGGDDEDDGVVAQPAATVAVAAPTQAPAASMEPVVNRVIITNPAPNVEANNAQKDLNPPAGVQLKPTYESLIGYDAVTGELTPQLAKSWSIEPDGFSIRFQLQEGVRFHGDNGEFTAKDIVLSHSQHIREDATHSHRRVYAAGTVEVVSDYEAVLRMKGANAEILRLISELNMSSMDISSAVDFAKIGEPTLVTRAPAGTGVFQYVSREQGVNVLFERVPYKHWRVEADFPEMEFRWISEASTRLAGLLTGETHITQLPEDQMLEASNAGMVVSQGSIDAQRVFIGWKGVYQDDSTACGYKFCDTPFLDVKVRKAMNKALNRAELNTAFFGGKGKPMYMNHLSPNGSYNNPAWEANFASEYGYDPAAARALLAEAGYDAANPLEIGVEVTVLQQFTQSGDVMESAAAYWSDIGIKANLLTIDSATLRAQTRALEYSDHVIFHGTPDFDMQGWRVRNSSLTPRGSGIELYETDEVLARIRGTLITSEQNDLLRELGDVAYPLHTAMFMFWVPAELVYNPDFVASYDFPGSPPGIYSHFERIKAVMK